VDEGEIALFPLHTVLFPGGLLPLRIFEARYMDMARRCLREDTGFGVCLIREGREVGAPAVPAPVGCYSRITWSDMTQLGVLEIRALGTERFRILGTRAQPDGLLLGRFERLPDAPDAPVPAEYSACVALFERFVAQIGARHFHGPPRTDSCQWLSGRLAELLPLPLEYKQRLLETDEPSARLAGLQRLIAGNPA
jgi:hypothetical protein